MVRFLGIVILAISSCPAQTPSGIPDLVRAAQTSFLHADYDGARQSLLKAWDLAQQATPDDPTRYDVLKRLSAIHAASGNFAAADDYLQQAISWRETTLGANDAGIPDDLVLSVSYCRGASDYDRALKIMFRLVNLHMTANIASGLVGGNAMNSVSVADDFSRIAQIQAERKQVDAAVNAIERALGIRTRLKGPLDASLVYDLDRLAGLQITLRTYDKAEESYRHALVIRETLYGKSHADLLATVDGLAYSLFGQQKYDEAEPLYDRLLTLWIESVGEETHPMVAVALDKIAIFYAAQKKWDRSREASTRANSIRAYLLADGLMGQSSRLAEEGKIAETAPLYRRALAVLDLPNPIPGDMELTEAVNDQRSSLEGMLKELEKVVKKPVSPAPPRSKK